MTNILFAVEILMSSLASTFKIGNVGNDNLEDSSNGDSDEKGIVRRGNLLNNSNPQTQQKKCLW